MSDLGIPNSYPEYPSVAVHSGDNVLLAFESTRAAIVTDPCGPLTPCVVVFNGLGGYAKLLNYVSILTDRLGTDPLINARFSTTDMDALGALMHAQLCALTGGYCRYLGLDMATAHAGMCITHDEWTATMAAFISSLIEAGIPYTAPNFDGGLAGDILLLTIMTMESDIVTEEGCD
jgi:hemoglobin